jgi:hypothetical protein
MYKFTVMVENEQDAKFLASCLRGVAATNSIRLLKEDGTPVVDGDLKACAVSEVLAELEKRTSMNAMKLVVGKKYMLDDNPVTVVEVNQDAAKSAWYAFLVDESEDLGFELVADEGVWRHQDSGDVAVIVEEN